MTGASLIVLGIAATQPVFITTVMVLYNNPNFTFNCVTLLLTWTILYFGYPQLNKLLNHHIFYGFLTEDEQMTLPESPQQSVTEFTIEYFFSIIVSACALFVYPMAFYRTDTSEFGDRYIVIAITCVATLTFILLQFFPQLFHKIRTFKSTKIVLLLLVLLFFGMGLREDSYNNLSVENATEFRGFGSIMFVCLLLLVGVRNLYRNPLIAPILRLSMKILSLYVLVMGFGAILINVNVNHNVHSLYIVNEMITPLTKLHPYSTFITQYVNLYQYFPQILKILGITQYPQLTINLVFLFLQFMSLITIGIAVYLNYYFMPQRSIVTAIIFTVPFFFISTRPFWDYSAQYFTLHLFSYSLIPVRIFAVLGVGSICGWLLRKAYTYPSKMILYVIICGIIASIGIYQNNDFGLFAAIGVGTGIVFQPFQTWTKRIGLASLFVISTIVWFGILFTLNVEWATVNGNYLFWFQRAFVSGFGGLPIKFPGNGLMIIICIIAIWLCTLKVYMILQKHTSHYSKDPLISSHFFLLMFMTTTTILGISYYMNRSTISFQGSSMYIGLGISVFLLYQLIMRMTMHQTQLLFSRYTNVAFQLLALLPIAIAVIYTPLFSRLDQDSIIIKKIIVSNPNDLINTPEYKELHITQILDIYTALRSTKMKIAFVGDFANMIDLYTNIPTANVFDHTSINLDATALNIYCNQIEQMPYDIFFINSIKKTYPCNNMMLLISQKIDGQIYLHKNFATNYPQQWNHLREILCPSEGFSWDSPINEQIRYCKAN